MQPLPGARERGRERGDYGTASPELRAAYEDESRRGSRRGAIAFCLIAAVVILAAIPLDGLRFPEVARVLLRIRLWGVAALLGVAGLLKSAIGERHPRLLALLVPGVTAALLFALASVVGNEASPFHMSVNFVLIGVALLIPWPAVWSALAALLVLSGYVAATLVGEGTTAGAGMPFADHLIVFTASGVLAIIMTVVLDRRRWREFARDWALAAAHRAERAGAERYGSVVETAGSAIILVSPDGRIFEFNREAERVLGWSRDQAIGREFLSLCVCDASREPVAGALARALALEPVHALEARLTTATGAKRVLVCNTSRLADGEGRPLGVVLCAQDITDRKRVEGALRESENRLRTVIATSPVVLFAIDQAGVVTLSEGRGLARLGLSPGEVVGLHIAEIEQALQINPSYASAFQRALAGETTVWVGSAGEATFECRLTPMRDAEGRIGGVIGVAIDVTERRQAEETRLGLERKLLEAQKLESLGVLAGGLAHDFSNLLVTVLGNASLAKDAIPGDSPARERLERIETAARRGSDLTHQLLAYAGRGTVVLEPVALNGIVEETKDLLEVSIGGSVRVAYDLARDLPAVAADATQLRQVVMNLVINAAESVGDRAGMIAVRTSAVQLGAEELEETHHARDAAPGPHVCLEVTDSGCGMDAATMARIFDPFFTTKVTGRGLGLATVLGVVRAHRGALAVRSEPARGTTFRVLLPLGPVMAAAEGVAAAATPRADAPGGRTVLLVDDEDDVRAITAHMLGRLGLSVLEAGDGREGVEVFRAHAKLIDAVILDLTLPHLSGDKVVRAIRDIRPDACVILMSGFDHTIAMRSLGDVGLVGFLRKPFSVADLRSTMGRALGPAES